MIPHSNLYNNNRSLSIKYKSTLFLIVGVSQIYRISALRKIYGNKGYGFLLKSLSRIGVFEFLVTDYTGTYKFELSSNDKFWLNAFLVEKNYEVEISEFLARIRVEFNFLDLGSNIGYWAVMASSLQNCKKIVPVEANLALIPRIKKNLEINSVQASVLNRAVVSTDASNVIFHIPLDITQHAASSLRQLNRSAQTSIKAINYDSLIDGNVDDNSVCIVKMDLEGIEYEILSTSQNLSNPKVIVIYEEHGSDRSSNTTEFLLSGGLHDVYLLTPNQAPIRISSPEVLTSLKKDLAKGYNCVSIPKMINSGVLDLNF